MNWVIQFFPVSLRSSWHCKTHLFSFKILKKISINVLWSNALSLSHLKVLKTGNVSNSSRIRSKSPQGSRFRIVRKKESFVLISLKLKNSPAARCCNNVVTTSICSSQWRRRYVPNETPNEVSMKRRQGLSVVRLLDV